MATTKGRKRPTYDRAAMQARVVGLLREGSTLTEACSALGLRRVTVWRWTQSDPAFRGEFDAAGHAGSLTARMPSAAIPPLELAYAAGFFDGEGCVRIARGPQQKTGRRYYIATVNITNTNFAMMQFFHDRWAGYWEKDVVNGKNPNAKHYSSWKLAGILAEKFLRDVYPYLRVKRPQAELVFEFRAFVGVARRTRDRSDAEYQQLQEYHARSRHLNARGTTPVVVLTT